VSDQQGKSRSYNVRVNDHHMRENTFVPPPVNKQPEVTKMFVVKSQKPPILKSSTPITPRRTVTGVSNDTRTEDVWTTPINRDRSIQDQSTSRPRRNIRAPLKFSD
jgi:hypothetical protein